MEQSLSGLTLQQSIGAGGNLIGKSITGIDASGDQIQGTVTSVKVQDKNIFLELDSGGELPMDNVTLIASPPTTGASALTSLLQNGSSSGRLSSSTLTGLANMLAALAGKAA